MYIFNTETSAEIKKLKQSLILYFINILMNTKSFKT